MPLVGQQLDARCMTTIRVTSSVHEFLSAANLLMGGWQAYSGILLSFSQTESRVPRPCVFCKGGSR